MDEVSLLHRAGGAVELRRVGNNLPAEWRTTSSGWADIPNAPTRRFACCAVPFCASTGKHRKCVAAHHAAARHVGNTGQLPLAAEHPERRLNPEALEAELLGAIFNPRQAGSLRAIADQLERLGMLVRDRTSNDLWRVVVS